MVMQGELKQFSDDEIKIFTNAATFAEELVAEHYKISVSEWSRYKYDIKTMENLVDGEIIRGRFAQIIRYEGKKKDSLLGTASFDLYKICIQDSAVLNAVLENPGLNLFAFTLYIMTHELVHVVRFNRFMQSFEASDSERQAEEGRVHGTSREILADVAVDGMDDALAYFEKWGEKTDGLFDG